MKVLIVSDNHSNEAILNELVEKYQDQVDYFIHCGDSEMAENDLLWGVMTTVRGNTDYAEFNEVEVIATQEGNILVTHGHLYQVKRSLKELVHLAKIHDAEVACFGHTHVMVDTEDAGIKVINPGSISLPRGDYPYPSYAILDWQASKKDVTFYNYKHEEIKV